MTLLEEESSPGQQLVWQCCTKAKTPVSRGLAAMPPSSRKQYVCPQGTLMKTKTYEMLK